MANLSIHFDKYPDFKLIRLNYTSRYASGSFPVITTEQLINYINEVCGKGSYLCYSKTKVAPNGARAFEGNGNLGYVQQGFKTEVIENAYFAAKDCIEHFNYNSITEWVEEFYDWCD